MRTNKFLNVVGGMATFFMASALNTAQAIGVEFGIVEPTDLNACIKSAVSDKKDEIKQYSIDQTLDYTQRGNRI